ncbi:MAG: prepilin-type N-terminal cleavage/methylation domain-containing protein, partial [Planctomycetaceae bacterium]|nr:prepilin-type N-terminal cleavage/methylation domain-containing protein [Planctomycetaceae bacterium]
MSAAMKPKNQWFDKRSGMTLVELLVVAAVLVALLAVSVPVFKPMLESRQTQNAAQVLAAALQQARITAVKEQRTYGLAFIPFETAPATSLQLRLQKENVS